MKKKKFNGQSKDEYVLYFARENFLRYFFSKIADFGTIFGIGLIFMFISLVFNKIIVAIIIALFVVFTTLIMYVFLFWRNTYLIITNDRLIKFSRDGIFKSHIREINIYSIQECISKCGGFIDKVLNCGSVTFIGKDLKIQIYFDGVNYPEELTMYVSRLREFMKNNSEYPPKEITCFMPRKIRKEIKNKKL
ncbi:hypothetical protein [Candidatus Vampirococcus lugosii]|uniref:DUF304 domain-containing protein n=1 Tax=Candidatus Vampirococcus lugosii TaxID=2789015 RepID=A0ABS5QLZ5_9BACT|nr:hypothetical protein [Candidatus Vampirococcus lugosii]MBS8122230.1 hypothetical protein [Candidatus Vampirococcus lugosii]